MSASVLNSALIVPASVHVRLKHETGLAAMTEELAGLRFSILLLARSEGSRDLDAENRAGLRDELAQLRALYFETIDEVAMSFGVQQAMDAKKEVERNVAVPRDMMPPMKARASEQLYF
ncbi:MAG: hypothetical protein WBE72_19820 [Terracidiphilus sp.]